MKFFIAFIAAIAMANAAVLVKEPLALERTSIVGPSGTITQDKNIPFVGTAIAEEPLLKVSEPATIITNPAVVPAVKTVEPLAVKTVEPVAVPLAKVETIPTSVVSPVGVPLVKTVLPLVNDWSYMPYDPFYFYQPKYYI